MAEVVGRLGYDKFPTCRLAPFLSLPFQPGEGSFLLTTRQLGQPFRVARCSHFLTSSFVHRLARC